MVQRRDNDGGATMVKTPEATARQRRGGACFPRGHGVKDSGGEQQIQLRQTDDESSLLELEIVRWCHKERRGETRRGTKNETREIQQLMWIGYRHKLSLTYDHVMTTRDRTYPHTVT